MSFGLGDYVRSITEQGDWEGTVVAVSICNDKVLDVAVRVDDPRGSTRRLEGDQVICRPEWLEIIRKRDKVCGEMVVDPADYGRDSWD